LFIAALYPLTKLQDSKNKAATRQYIKVINTKRNYIIGIADQLKTASKLQIQQRRIARAYAGQGYDNRDDQGPGQWLETEGPEQM